MPIPAARKESVAGSFASIAAGTLSLSPPPKASPRGRLRGTTISLTSAMRRSAR